MIIKRLLVLLTALLSIKGTSLVTADPFNDLQKCIETDLPYNGQSVFWNGRSASIIEDEIDTEETAGDRYSYWNTNLYISGDKMWSFYYIDLKDDPKTIIQDDSFTLFSDSEYIKAQKADYQEECMLLEKSESMTSFDDEALDAISSRSEFQSIQCGYGLKTIEDITYAGYTAVFTTKHGDSYRVDYYGIGNMDDIKSCFMEILSSFIG